MNGVQTRFKCKLDVKRCKRFVFPPSSLLPRSNALKTKAIRYFQTDRTLTRIVSPPLLVKVKFEQGAVGTPHTHYHTQTTYVASGKFEFTVNGEKQIVETGDGVYIEPDAVHGCVCLEAGILIDCFSPMRADFLKR